MGEYFQVHPFQSIEDGLPVGEYFQVHPYKSIEDGEYFACRVFSSWESIFKFTLINLLESMKMGLPAYWRVFSSSPL